MKYVLKDSEYTFDASANTITLLTPWDGINIGQILSILNLTVKEQIYDSKQSYRHPVSLSGAVVTHTYDNSHHADTDKLQIIIETENADYSDLDTILVENVVVAPGEVVVSDWYKASGHKEITAFVKTDKTCVTSIQVTDDNVSANPDAFTLCAKDGAGTPISLNTSATEQGLSYTFTNKAEKIRSLTKNNGTTDATVYVAVK